MHKLIEDLQEKAAAKDIEGAKAVLLEMRTVVLQDKVLIGEIVQPTVISELHNLLIENFGVNTRAMQLKARVPRTASRALLFIRAMENGMNRLK